jgi:hypothetical protein
MGNALGGKKKDIMDLPVIPEKQLFGIPLADAARRSNYSFVPWPILRSIEWLNRNALEEEGLWRQPGAYGAVSRYMRRYDRGEDVVFPDDELPFTVCSTVVRYLQKLPDNLFGDAEARCKDTARMEPGPERTAQMKQLLDALPRENRETVRCLVNHYRLVALRSEVNKMTVENIAVCCMPRRVVLIQMLINEFDALFPAEEGGGGTPGGSQGVE